MSIKAIIIDFGGVLYFTPDLNWMKRWEKLLGLRDDPFINSLLSSPDDSEYVNDIMVGKIDEGEFWGMLAKRLGLNEKLIKRLHKGAYSAKRWNKDLAEFISSLRPQYKTAILSNAGSDARSNFSLAYKIDRLVDEIIISAEEKIAKPDERIYQIALERLQVAPDEAIFLDDLLPNVEAARKMGIQAVQFQETTQAISDLKKLLG